MFFRCQLFEHIENLSNREFLDEEGAEKVSETLKELRKIFYKPLPPSENTPEKADEFFKELSIAAELSPWITYRDNRPR